MTKKDYVLIATILRDARKQTDGDARHLIDALTEDFSYALARDNSRFDSDKFVRYVNGK